MAVGLNLRVTQLIILESILQMHVASDARAFEFPDCTALTAHGAAWRTGLRRGRQVPFTVAVSLVSTAVPILDTVTQRFISVIISCLIKSLNEFATYIVKQSIVDVQMKSYITRNLHMSCVVNNFIVAPLLPVKWTPVSVCTTSYACRQNESSGKLSCVSSMAESVFARERLFRTVKLHTAAVVMWWLLEPLLYDVGKGAMIEQHSTLARQLCTSNNYPSLQMLDWWCQLINLQIG
jgi:hypothetical protein